MCGNQLMLSRIEGMDSFSPPTKEWKDRKEMLLEIVGSPDEVTMSNKSWSCHGFLVSSMEKLKNVLKWKPQDNSVKIKKTKQNKTWGQTGCEFESCPKEVNGHAKPTWNSVVWSQASALIGLGKEFRKGIRKLKARTRVFESMHGLWPASQRKWQEKGKRNRYVFLRKAVQQNLKVAGRDCTSGYMEKVSFSLPRR